MHSREIDEEKIKTQVEANDEEGYCKKSQKTPSKTCPWERCTKLPIGEDGVENISRLESCSAVQSERCEHHQILVVRQKAKLRSHASIAHRVDETNLLIKRLMTFVATFAGSTRCLRSRPECHPPKTRQQGSLHQPKGFCWRMLPKTKSQWSTHRRYPCRNWPGGSHPRPGR